MIDTEDPKTIVAFTDGSCHPNPGGPGGWAFYVRHGRKHAIRYGFEDSATNNRAELLALLRALQFIPASEKSTSPLVIYTDSEYSKHAATDWGIGWRDSGWKTANGKPVKNRELVEEILRLMEVHKQFRVVEVRWVRGHSGIRENEAVDRSANAARKGRKTNWTQKDNKHAH